MKSTVPPIRRLRDPGDDQTPSCHSIRVAIYGGHQVTALGARLYVRIKEQSGLRVVCLPWSDESFPPLDSLLAPRKSLPKSAGATSPPIWAEFCAFLLPSDKREDRLGDLYEWYAVACEKFRPFAVRFLLVYHVSSWFAGSIRWLVGRLLPLGVLGWLANTLRKIVP